MDRDQTIMAILIVASTIGAIVFADSRLGLFTSGSENSESNYSTPVQYQTPVPAGSATCGSASSVCSVSTSAIIKNCNRSEAENATKQSLENPLKSEECIAADRKLANSCPTGCRIDFRTRLVLPSQTKYSLHAPDADGSCKVDASKTVTFRVGCFN